ncbi:MAG: hypothetical protein JJU36_04725 [Phycisphaeraceae bacterium]|nr:hypothetical protein [Phycisphaeraceae bacterium]
MANAQNHEASLRIIRFFLPRLSRSALTDEIEAEKARLRSASEARLAEITWQGEAGCASETREWRDQLAAHASRRDRNKALLTGVGLAIVPCTIIGALIAPTLGAVVALAALVALIMAGVHYWIAARHVRSCHDEIDAIAIRNRQSTDRKLTEERAMLQDRVRSLDARIEELVVLYEGSIATEDEVVSFCAKRLEELQSQVPRALGIEPDDILDERSAEIWAPTFLQLQELPISVLRDAIQSEQDIRKSSDQIIEPMRKALLRDDQWQAFTLRILPMLGLADRPKDKDNARADNGSESASLSALRAVRFSCNRQTYLAGHYFYQKIVCIDDRIGVFRGYVNILNHRVPHTSALEVFYSDVTAIGIETGLTPQRFILAGMTIDQHTHTLTLEVSSGTQYRMSGDAGSEASLHKSVDREASRVASEANKAFRDQIINVRGLIRDAKAGRGTVASAFSHQESSLE